jgi:fucose permease
MAPIFPAALAMTGDKFTRMTATAMGVVITSGWIGLAVSSRLIGAIAGPDPQGIRTGLMLLPVFSVLMIALNLVIRPLLGPAPGAVKAAVEQQAETLSHKSG